MVVEELEVDAGVDAFDEPYDTARIQPLIDEANAQASAALRVLLGALLVLAALPRPPQRYTYEVNRESYREGDRVVEQSELSNRINADAFETAARLRRLTEDYNNGRLSLDQWQRRVARIVLLAQLRMTQAGAGTAARIRPAHLSSLRSRLRAEFSAIVDIGDRVRSRSMSPKMMLYRAAKLGFNTVAGFWAAQHISHSGERWLALRRLDPNAAHCPSCPAYDTDGRWLPADEVTPVGTDCECLGFCRCTVRYRLVTLSDRLPGL